MSAFYNEIDPHAAAWLRELISKGLIAPGVVDERSIEDIRPEELTQYTQFHFFAGIGVWSYALRRAGWPDDVPCWTGSCPCQPFSAAGAGAGFDDERHLWPSFAWLIEQCKPSVVFGEQVASKAVEPWVDLVHADLEAMGYAFGAVPFPSAGVGAPHIRDRLFWVADSADQRQHGRWPSNQGDGRDAARIKPERFRDASGMADSECKRIRSKGPGSNGAAPAGMQGEDRERQRLRADFGAGSAVMDADGAGPVNGFWRAADWLGCRDDKWRPVEPGTFPLVNGAAARVGRLRGYGNAINAQAAQAFIEAYIGA